MAHEMPAEFAFGFFPAAQRFGRRGQSGIDAEIVEQAVHVERQEILLVQFHGALKGTVQEAHIHKRKSMNLKRNRGRYLDL